MTPANNQILLRIRPSLPDPDEVSASRGPLMMEAVLSSLHSLKGKDPVSLEIGLCEGKIALFARSSVQAGPLVESQLYAQYPDAEIEPVPVNTFEAGPGEIVLSTDLSLLDPEVFPIKRFPQYVDMVTRQMIDTIAGITSSMVRYPVPGMRGHVSVTILPIGKSYRRRALRFLPLLMKGLPKHLDWYEDLFAKIHLARGWRRLAYFPLDMLMGGFRAWFIKLPSLSLSTETGTDIRDDDDEENVVGMRNHDRENKETGAVDKLNRLLFTCNVRISVITPASGRAAAEAKVEEIAGSFRQFNLPHCNGFEVGSVRESTTLPLGFHDAPYVLSNEEIATLWHVPNILVKTPNFDWVYSRKLEPPVDLPVVTDTQNDDLTVLGEAVFRGHRTKFGIKTDDRRRHIYTIGKTGMGKSTLLENMIYSDIISGKGVALIDPHGDLVEAVLRFIPKERTNDVILFDPADKEHPVAFNMLSCKDPEQGVLVVSGLMSIFKKMWPEAFSGRMEYILRNTLLALIEAGNQSMLGIMRMFSDPVFRRKILEHVENHMVKSFWEDEFTSWSEKYQTEALAAIQNKVGQLLSAPLIRNIVGQVVSKVDFRHAMDTGKIVLMNLSKGRLGEDNSAFLGSMFVTKFQLDAMSRADIPEKERKDFYLYVDEFQNFATESFATILSEARKYRLNLTVAHQYVNQLLMEGNNTALRDAVFGNVGSMISFQVGSDDAEPLSEQFEEMVLPKDILSLPKYHAYVRLMIKGIPSKPFSVSTLAPPALPLDDKRLETIRRLSSERYAEDRKTVEEKITKWVQSARESA
ncbi:MAG: type IV secretion system DNA-binding domain-containing protein, partial [Candidatus Peribacteraceae bacterium]|nr:type IV secretion system DNA-binding domain-containing protein [Candidatus Peribacteraceae bacterium]